MNARRSVALVLTLSLVFSALPAMAAPRETAPSSGTALGSSIDRALQASPRNARAASATPRAMQANGMGGGGGGSHMAVVLLGLAVSAGTTYFLIKQLKKQEPVPTPTFGVGH